MVDNAEGVVAVNQSLDEPGYEALRALTQNGVAISDPRCQTLLALLQRNSNGPGAMTQPPTHAMPPPANRPQARLPALHASAAGTPYSAGQTPAYPPRIHPPTTNARAHAAYVPPQAYASGGQAAYPPRSWGGAPAHGVPYMQHPGAYSYPHGYGAPSHSPSPQNVHASYARNIVPQPVLAQTPNHAFSYEDNQHAFMARRLALEQQVAAQRAMSAHGPADYQRAASMPAASHPAAQPHQAQPHRAQHHRVQTQPPSIDPSQHFFKLYSPTRGTADASNPNQAAMSTAQRAEQEKQLRALDLLSLHGGNAPGPNVQPPSGGRPVQSANVGNSAPPAGSAGLPQAESKARGGVNFLLSANNVSPKTPQGPAALGAMAVGNVIPPASAAPSGAALGGNILNELEIDFGEEPLLPNDFKDFSLQEVAQNDNLFRVAATAAEKAKPKAAAPKKPRKPRAPKKTKKPKEPKEPKEPKKAKRPKKPKAQPVTSAAAANTAVNALGQTMSSQPATSGALQSSSTALASAMSVGNASGQPLASGAPQPKKRGRPPIPKTGMRRPMGAVSEECIDEGGPETAARRPLANGAKKPPKPRKKRAKRAISSKVKNPVMDRIRSGLDEQVNNLSMSQMFQMKAQAEAHRRISRGLEPPPEVTAASGGGRPASGNAFNGIVLPSDLLRKGAFQMKAGNLVRRSLIPGQSKQNAAGSSVATAVDNVRHANALDDYRRRTLELAGDQRDHLLTQQVAHLRTLKFEEVEQQMKFYQDRANGASAANAKSEGETVHAAPKRRGRPPKRKTPGVKTTGILKNNIAKSAILKAAAAPVTIAPPQYNGKTFRELLFEREQRISSRIQRRHAELDHLPADIPEDIRRRAIIEKKQLNLLSLQRKARASVTNVMHSLFTKGTSVAMGHDGVNIFRRPTPTHWSWREAGGTVNTGGALSAQARKNIQKLEQKHRMEQEHRRRSRQLALMDKLKVHVQDYRASQAARAAQHKKLMKDLDRFFSSKARREEQRKKKENHDRLRALKNNNEEEYFELVKKTKNKRLLQLLNQTDQYLSQIGAQVEKQKEAAKREDLALEAKKAGADAAAVAPSDDAKPVEEGKGGGEDELQAMKQSRNKYYTVTHTVKEKVYQPKSLIGGTLKPYQLEGLEWLVSLYNNNLNGILADEMGLGKTIQTLSLITYLVEVKKVPGPYLVIVPLSTMSNWVRELESWAPSLSKVVYRGDPATRRKIQHSQMIGGNYNVLLTTYEFVVRDKAVLGKIGWKYIIIDEGHRMKNSDCKLALTLGSKYRSRNRILLTGTPLQNNLTELWALLNFLLPSIFSNSDTFETWFNAPFQAASLGGEAELNEEENLLVISRLHQVLRPFMLRRLKTDVEAQLPDKVEEVFRCDMSIWQRTLYDQLRRKLGIAAGGATGSTRSFNNMMMQLKKVCNHPYLFYSEEELASVPPDNLIRASGKFELLNHALKKLKATGHRVLMFSQMTAALDYLEIFLYNVGIKCLRLDGTTKADDRQEMLEKFNAPGSPYDCFLLSTRAGGLGLNLQTADTVIIFDSDWNPMMDLQAQDRAHRIGQTKEVRVFRLIVSGSVEVKILERANRKLKMDAQVIQAGQFNNKSSDNDRQEMLKDILRSDDKDGDIGRTETSSLESINQMLARSDEELELFEEMDRERLEKAGVVGRTPLMIDENELPAWVRLPEVEKKSKEQLEAEYMVTHGRGRRKRKAVTYEDVLTEKEWTEAIEEDLDLEEVSRKKRMKLEADGGGRESGRESGRDTPQPESTDLNGRLASAQESIDKEAIGRAKSAPASLAGSARASVDRGSFAGSARPSVDRDSTASAPTKLEPFVDPELNRPPRQKRGRGRPKKQG